MYYGTISVAIFVGFLAAASALAQQSQPSRTTATYDAWTVRCSTLTLGEGEEARSICELVQAARLRETGQTILETALGQLSGGEPFQLVFKVPNSVWLRKPVTLLLQGEGDEELTLNARYVRCTANACIADVEIEDEQLDTIVTATAATVSFTDATQKPISIPLTMTGLPSAFFATFTLNDG